MAGSEDCKEIEKCIKDLIFKAIPREDPISPSRGKKPGFNPSNFPPDKRCFVSQIEKSAHRPTSVHPPFGRIPTGQVGASELIDLNVLTTFAAQHIEDPPFSPSDLSLDRKAVQLPHPDLEDDEPKNGEQGVSVWLDRLSKNIQGSPSFLGMPENPLSQMSGKPKLNGPHAAPGSGAVPPKPRDQNSEKKDQKKKKRPPKKQKVKKSLSYKRTDNELNKSVEDLKDVKTEIKSPVPNPKKLGTLEKQNSVESEKCTNIKLKKDAFASIGKEYSLFKNEGHFKFQCHICNWNNDSIDLIVNHITYKNHCLQKSQNDMDMMLSFLPEPLKPQVDAITDLLLSIAATYGLKDSDIAVRKELSVKLNQYVENHLPGCSIDLVGSTAFNCGLKTSEVDFVLNVGANQDIPDSLEELYDLMSKDKAFDSVVNDFKKKRPQILFIDHENNLPCNILIDNGSSLKIANILSAYFQLDERVKTLGIALRYWAKLCLIDEQDRGTLPSFAFALLLVHFLQQVQPPVLPVLHETKNYASTPEFYDEYISENKWKSQNTDSAGQLWIKLFQYYNFDYKIGDTVVCIRSSKRVTCKDKSWNTKFYAVEDPFVKRNVAYVIPTYQVCHFIQQCFIRTYRYFAYPQLKDGSVSLLKTEFFDALELSEYVPNTIALKEGSDDSDESDNEECEILNTNPDLEDHDPDISIDDFVATVSNLTLKESGSENTVDKHQDSEIVLESLSGNGCSSKKQAEKLKEATRSTTKISNPICYWDLKGKHSVKEDFKYEFVAVTFKGNKTVPLNCKLCKGQGHQKKDCPSDDLPPVGPLPPMHPEFMNIVSNVLNSIRDRNLVSKKDINIIENHMKDIETCIRKVYPDATLKLFGSYCNGFGFKSNSDMDFCLTFDSHLDGKDLNSTDIIKKVGKQLNSHPDLENVVPITSAKVPIVKFSWKQSGIEADISLYNTLALVNTEMLDAYSKIDPRVQVLGYALKHFAKHLGICDASRGSLSSYAYILMVIFFLQQRNPPVIPVLQELYKEAEKPSLKVEDCNVWFCRDINRLKEIWEDFGKNKESVGELWLGLLNFYTCEFNWKDYVVSIKQKKPLTRFKKLWQSDQLAIEVKQTKRLTRSMKNLQNYLLAIEDPFDLNHNLGAGLSKKMNSYILKTFIRGRERFGTPILLEQPEPFLFQRNFLNSGCEPPQDRGCGNCGKIGHLARNCPQEKTCSYCRRPGHLIKNCPRKREKRPKDKSRPRVGYNNMEQKDKERRMNYNQGYKNDFKQRTFRPPPEIRHSNLAASGIPSHRFPVPGFPGHRPIGPKPPPGFIGPGIGPYTPPFSGMDASVPPPFPRSKNDMSPSKQFGSSPPKNPNKLAFHPPTDSWNRPRRNPQVQQMRGPPWDRKPSFPPPNRTNADGPPPYNSSRLERWNS